MTLKEEFARLANPAGNSGTGRYLYQEWERRPRINRKERAARAKREWMSQ